jgi:hypothetical protein
MAEDTRPCFVLLMRHRSSQPDGQRDVQAVATRLAETLSELQRPGLEQYRITLRGIWHGDSAIASETATTVRYALAAAYQHDIQKYADPVFNAMHASPFSGPSYEKEKDDGISAVTSALADALANDSNAVMVIGHQPLMSVLAGTLVRRSVPWLASSVPLARGEVACLAGRRSGEAFQAWRLLWTIAPTDETSTAALRDKIAAKMQVAGILGSVTATGLVLLLQGIVDRTGSEPAATTALRYAAAAALFAAVWLYLSTVYACDRLLMPTRFWNEPRNPTDLSRRPTWLIWRPPGSDAWIIYQNMLHVWRWQFVPATSFLVAGIGLLGIALPRPATIGGILVPILATVLVIASLFAYSFWRRPHLGVED